MKRMLQTMGVVALCGFAAACGSQDLLFAMPDGGGELPDLDSSGVKAGGANETYALESAPQTECATLDSTFPVIKPTTNPDLFVADVVFSFSKPTLLMFSLREAGARGWPVASPAVARPADSGWFFLGPLKAGAVYEYRLSWLDPAVYPWRECGTVDKRFDVPSRR